MAPDTETLLRRRRPGFSLVLSLVVMSVVLLTVITVASFVTIESRLAAQHQNFLRAKLNAAVSLRLALAHLQQEAGPDRRMTARADILANTTQAGWTWNTIRNPLWTGVWRSDQQLQPPSWLVSGRPDMTPGAQSANLYGEADFYIDQWVPWQNDFTLPANLLVPLVGDTCASGPELATATSPGKPDGRITLPRVPLPDAGSKGSYCYWIGDEGVKARINLTDPRLTPASGTTTAQLQQEALRGTVRSGTDLLAGLETMPLSGIDPRITQMRELPFLTNSGLGLIETTPPTRAKRLFSETTLWSRGVNCDSLWGGLKIDLSLAFEKTDAEWKLSEFGEGSAPKDSAGAQLSGVTYTSHPSGSGVRSAFADAKVTVKHDGVTRNIAPLYSFASNSTTRGPTWEALRNYHRLYKELNWFNPIGPELNARAHYPNAVALAVSAYGDRNHYGRFYDRADAAGDFLNATTVNGLYPPKPTKVAVSPYVCRQMLVWGLQDGGGGALRLTITPIVVLHNPYNVALRLARDSSSLETTAMRLSFRNWESLSLQFQTPTQTWTRTIGELAAAADPSVNAVESFRMNLGVDNVLLPGEFRIFSYPATGAAPTYASTSAFTRTPANAIVGMDTRGGFWMNCTDAAGMPLNLTYGTGGENVAVTLRNTGSYEARVLLTSWPGDRIAPTGNGSLSAVFNTCSELNTLSATDLSRSGGATSLVIGGTGIVLPDTKSEPRILGIHDYVLRWPKDTLPFPVFSHSNPMAAVTRADANGMASASTPAGYAFTSPSYRMMLRPANSWNEVIETATVGGSQAFGGLSVTSGLGGVTSAVYTEVPLSAPLSLAQYTHANFGLRDQEPLFQIGNSFSPLTINIASSYGTDPGGSIVTHDHAWMANSAIYDRFFLSGAAPVVTRGQVVTESKSLSTVLDEFAAGTGRLANPRTKLFASRDPATVRAMLGDHRRIAGTILTDGTFNVNSTSVDAWTALLASAKRNAMGSATALLPGSDKNARFPRSARADASDYNYKTALNDKKAWTGLATLDDAQIKLLAKSIVEETRMRLHYNHRYSYGIKPGLDVHYVIKDRGVEVPLPYIGLAQFVNRFNCGAYPSQVSYQGCLQNAILRADVDGANLSNRSSPLAAAPAYDSTKLTQLTGSTPDTNPAVAGQIPYVYQTMNVNATDPRTSQNKGHSLRAAPTSLMQSDILEAVGSSLSTRSDTFVIRCYGDSTDPLDPNRTLAGCWIEAVVQRIPEFCDPSQPPETEVCKSTDGQLHNPLLSQINRTLGRRFVILSTRTLAQKDL
ncbi:MAG: hypothetical protein WCL05_04510 [Verrucomicrobiota bacterium]